MDIRTYYIARVISVPPLVACAAYDDLTSESEHWHLRLAAACLVVGAPSGRKSACREAPARLYGKGQRLAATLEFEPWSSQRTQLGLRPARWGPRLWPSDRQLAAGHDALAVLGDLLLQWADEPLARFAARMEHASVTEVTE